MKIDRRTFNSKIAGGLVGATLIPNAVLASNFNQKGHNKLGVALVGLGSYSTWQLAPALLKTKHCYLAGIVTGTRSKAKQWMGTYNIPKENVYNYEDFDQIANNNAIDIVYVVLPNSIHADFCIRAAKAGKHVICEKPMAVSGYKPWLVAECDTIIEACKKAEVKLSVGQYQQTLQMDDFAKHILTGSTNYAPGDIGKRDMMIIEAIYKSIKKGGKTTPFKLRRYGNC
jgi:glucose-fructose oxidoreductase